MGNKWSVNLRPKARPQQLSVSLAGVIVQPMYNLNVLLVAYKVHLKENSKKKKKRGEKHIFKLKTD